MLEIERKYTVHKAIWETISKPSPIEIKQGYLSKEISCTTRVRTKGNKGYITVKGKNEGIVRAEFEYEIPLSDAIEMLDLFCPKRIEKKRYEIFYEDFTWEIDVFEGENSGLMIAEVELKNLSDSPKLPNWVDQDVSENPAFFNSNLIR